MGQTRWGLAAATVVIAAALAGCGGAAIPRSQAEIQAEAPFLGSAPVVAATTSRAPTVVTMVAIGDAYTSGSSYGGVGAKGWVAEVGTAMGWRTVNLSAPGDGYAAKGTDGQTFADKIDRAVTAAPQVLIVWGARNDIPESLSKVTTAVHDTFATIHQRLPNAVVVIIGPSYQTANAPKSYTDVRDVEKAAAQADGFPFIDPIAENWFGAKGLMNADNVHPTDAGFAHMSTVLEHDLAAMDITRLINEHILNPTPGPTTAATSPAASRSETSASSGT